MAHALALEVFRSPRHELMYLYLKARDQTDLRQSPDADADADNVTVASADLDALPEALLKHFGPPVFSFAFTLEPDRVLAAADTQTVLQAVHEQGYYLQMPPRLTLDETPDARNPHEQRRS